MYIIKHFFSRECEQSKIITGTNKQHCGTFKKKLYGPFLRIGFNCLKAADSLRGDILLLPTVSLGGRVLI